MAIEPNTLEFELLFYLTIVVIIAKVIFSLYLGIRILQKKKRVGEFQFDFMFGLFVLMLTLLISRIMLCYFDFFLTKLNEDTYYLSPNIEVWKTATLISVIGFIVLLFIIDKRVLRFKFKGIPAYILIGLALFQFLYPVDNIEDFRFISMIGLFQMVVVAWVPLLFLYIGIKTPGLRKISFTIVIAILIYAGGGLLVGEHILGPLRAAYGNEIHVLIFFVFVITKIIGLSLLSYSSTQFSM